MDGDNNEVLYDFNARQRMYPASITKIMTSLVVLDAVDAGEISLDTVPSGDGGRKERYKTIISESFSPCNWEKPGLRRIWRDKMKLGRGDGRTDSPRSPN